MEDKWSFRNNLTKITLVLFTLAFVLSMASMLTYAAGKAVIIENSDEETEAPEVKAQVYSHTIDLKSITVADSVGDVIVHCPAMPSAENVSVEQRYDKNTVTLIWSGNHGEYFLDNIPEGKMSHVKKLVISDNGEAVSFAFTLDTMCECEVVYTNRETLLTFVPILPEETIVAVDPGHGGASRGIQVGDLSEKDLMLSLAEKIRRLAKDRPYRVILLRSGDYALTDEERLALCETLGAECYIGLHAAADSADERTYGMYAEYNGSFYREGISNAEFADNILKNACLEASDRGIGLYDRFDELILRELTIPATNLFVGYMSNKDEASLLSNGTYVSKLAEGIINGIDETLK